MPMIIWWSFFVLLSFHVATANQDKSETNEHDPDKLYECGRLGPVPIMLPRRYQHLSLQMQYTDKMIISDAKIRNKFFRPTLPPCTCDDCATNTKCPCAKMSKVRLKDEKLAPYSNKYNTWDNPILPCLSGCECGAECGACPAPIDPARMYIGYNEKTKFSLYAADVIERGEMIGEYFGEVFLDDEDRNLDYTFQVPLYKEDDDPNDDKTDTALIDALRYANHTAIANHSCFPSAEAVYYYAQQEDDFTQMYPTIGIFAMSRILVDEEITINYGVDYWQDKDTHCECGSIHCFERVGWPGHGQLEDEESNDETNVKETPSAVRPKRVEKPKNGKPKKAKPRAVKQTKTRKRSKNNDDEDEDDDEDDEQISKKAEEEREKMITDLIAEVTQQMEFESQTNAINSVESSSNSNKAVSGNAHKSPMTLQPNDCIMLDSSDTDDDNEMSSSTRPTEYQPAQSSSNNQNQRHIKENGYKMPKKDAKNKDQLKNDDYSKSFRKNERKRQKLMSIASIAAEKGKGKMEEKIIIFKPKSNFLVREIRRIFWLCLQPFGVKVDDESEALNIFRHHLPVIKPANVIRHLINKVVTDHFVEKTKICERVEHQTELLFGRRIFSNPMKQSLDHGTQKENAKMLLFFYACLFRRLIGILEMPYTENETYGEKIDELKNMINQFATEIMREFSKKNIGEIDHDFIDKLNLTAQFEMGDKIIEIIYLGVYGIEVMMAPLIGQSIFTVSDNGKFRKNSFEKLDKITSRHYFVELIKGQNAEKIVQLWHNSAELINQHAYFKNQVTIAPRINALINSIMVQKQNKFMSNAKMYKMFFENLSKYFQMNPEELKVKDQFPMMAWYTMKNFIKYMAKIR